MRMATRYISSVKQVLPRRRPDQGGLTVKGRSSATEGSNSGPAYITAGYADAEVYSGLRRNAPGLGTYIYPIILSTTMNNNNSTAVAIPSETADRNLGAHVSASSVSIDQRTTRPKCLQGALSSKAMQRSR